MGKGGYEPMGRLWDQEESVDAKQEHFASSALDKHDSIVRRNLGMSDNQPASSSLNLNVWPVVVGLLSRYRASHSHSNRFN
jgi:hypothetical protein